MYTSLIDNMQELFSCDNGDKSSEINRKIDWNDSRNDIKNWNINRVINMQYIFFNSNFNQDLCNWVLKLDSNCNLFDFNLKCKHNKIFGNIDSYEDFIQNSVYSNYINTISVKANCLQFNLSMKQLTKKFIKETLQNGNDIDKFKMLKFLKQNPSIINHLKLNIDNNNSDINY